MGPARKSKTLPTLTGAGLVSAYYFFVAAALGLLAILMTPELLAGIFGGRLRWAFAARRALRCHMAVARAIIRSLRLRQAVDNSISLTVDDAPELFAMIEALCLQIGVKRPSAVFLEMEMAAWVRLRGDSGEVALGLGLDLLAGCSRSEIRAVLAHELSHAQLTQWALWDWLAHGLQRAVQLSRSLSRLTSPGHIAHRSGVARVALRQTNSLAEAAAQHIAAFSREAEFAADRGAARICGPDLTQKTLLKVEGLRRFAAHITWTERIGQIQTQKFIRWLVGELSLAQSLLLTEVHTAKGHRFSTHPSLRERINALASAPDLIYQPDARPGIDLLPAPDAMAEKLMARILEKALEQEENDSRRLRRWAGEMRAATEPNSVQKLAAGLVVAAEVAGVAAWIFGADYAALAAIAMTATMGILLYCLGHIEDPFSLPIPEFSLLRHTWYFTQPLPTEEIRNIELAILKRSRGLLDPSGKRVLMGRGFQYLTVCDYNRANVAARLLLARDPGSVPGHLMYAISSAWLGNTEDTGKSLAAIQRISGLKGAAVCWGVAWTYMLRGNWTRAEALLEQTLDHAPWNPALLNLRALCQMRRGKIHSAIIGARRACEVEPDNRDNTKFLLDLLIEAGYLNEAGARLGPLEAEMAHDPELMLTAVRLHLATRRFDEAAAWAETLSRSTPPAHILVQVAAGFELGRHLEEAGRYYQQALTEAYFPDACLGLSRIMAKQGERELARSHALAALNFRKPLGQHATPPLELLRASLSQLNLIEPVVRKVSAWMAKMTDKRLPAPLVGLPWVIYATSQQEAEKYLLTIIDAMAIGAPGITAASTRWQPAPEEHQPLGPARTGVQPFSDGLEYSLFRGVQRRDLWQSRRNQIESIIENMNLLPQAGEAA